MTTTKKDPAVLQHDRWGTMHALLAGETLCGNGTGPATVRNGWTGNFTRRSLSEARTHPRAHACERCAGQW